MKDTVTGRETGGGGGVASRFVAPGLVTVAVVALGLGTAMGAAAGSDDDVDEKSGASSSDGAVVLRRSPPPVLYVRGEDEAVTALAVERFQHTRAGTLLRSDPFEQFEQLARPEQLALFEGEERWLDIFLDGDDLFSFAFPLPFGAGRGPNPQQLPYPPQPVHTVDGGLDGTNCRACHFAGGPDGAGTATQRAFLRGNGHDTTRATLRDAPHVMGLGPVTRLAAEMTATLQATRAQAEALSATISISVPVPLVAKGVSFGVLIARPGGEVDDRGVDGVSSDLVVRPFGHKGRQSDLVGLVDEALFVHHGVQTASQLSRQGQTVVDDPDRDGVVAAQLWRDSTAGAEASAAQSVLLAGYLALLGVPEIHPPESPELLVRWSYGRSLLDETGCTLCHVEQLPMESDVVTLQAPAIGDVPGWALRLPLMRAQQEPKAVRVDFAPGSNLTATPVFLYSDLKRHEMGPALADDADEELPELPGERVAASQWLTRSLWGVADTAPYLHDGRAATLDEAILWHGGEAAGSRDAYLYLDDDDRAALRLFLASLSREHTVVVE